MQSPAPLLPPLAVDKLGHTESKLDLILARLEESHCLQLEMSAVLQKIATEHSGRGSLSSKPQTTFGRRVTEKSQRSEPRHSFISSEISSSQPLSLKKMEDVFFRELGAHLERSSSHGRPSTNVRPSALSAADHKGMYWQDDAAHLPGQPTSPQGNKEANLEVSPTRLQGMNRQSQVFILSTMQKIDEGQSQERWLGLDRSDQLLGSNLLLSRPCLLRSVVLLASLSQIAAILALKLAAQGQSQGHGFTLLSSVLYALGAFGSLLLLGRANRSADLELAISRLRCFVTNFTVRWNDVSGKEWRKFLFGWLALVLLFSGTQGFETWLLNEEMARQDSTTRALFYVVAVLSALSLCVSSGVVMLTGYMQSHVLLGLHKSLDCWCCDIANNPDFRAGVQNWNAMQALLKCVGRELANSFLLLQVMAVVGLACFLTGCATFVLSDENRQLALLAEGLPLLPLLFVFVLSMRVFAHAAMLTEKCRAIPAFVNQIPTEDSCDSSRQYLVHFIADSASGFSVLDVKVTAEMLMRQASFFSSIVSCLVGVLSSTFL